MTALFSLKSISKTYGDDTLFEDLSFDFKEKEKLGLIGMNGSGKSTLLKIIAQITLPDEGEVFCQKHINYGYLPQKDELDPDRSIEDILFQGIEDIVLEESERYRIVQKSIGAGNFPDSHALVNTLSGGWKKRLAIVRAMSRNPDILLLDEPTNHLDLGGILWLEKLLKNASFSYIVVSHDRRFLDNICETVMEIGRYYPKGYFRINGGYSEFIKEREKFLSSQEKLEGSLSSKMRREDEWLGQGAKARTTKAKYRIEQAYKLRMDLYDLKQRNRKTATMDIDFFSTGRQTKKLLTADNLSKTLAGNTLFKDISFELGPGLCLGIVGENGSGKSTFLNILEKTILPDTGKVKWAEDLKMAVFDQERTRLNPELSLKDALNPSGGDSVNYKGRTIHIVTWAKRFLFMPDQLDMPVKQLSGGEKARILIANLMLQPCDILLLDEPTNDLDILSLEVLEDSLSRFPGAVVLVSHDRYMMESLTKNLLYLDPKKGARFFKDYDQIMAFREDTPSSPKQKPKTVLPVKKAGPVKFSYKDKFELDHMEEKILEAETMVDDLQKKIQDPEVIRNPEQMADCCSRLSEAEALVNSLYTRWEELETKKSGQ